MKQSQNDPNSIITLQIVIIMHYQNEKPVILCLFSARAHRIYQDLNKFIHDRYKASFLFSFPPHTEEEMQYQMGKTKYLICNIASRCRWLTERCVGDRTRCRKDTNFPLTLLHKEHNFLTHILFNMTVVSVRRVKWPRYTAKAHQAYNIEYTWAIIKWKMTSKPIKKFVRIYQINKQGLL